MSMPFKPTVREGKITELWKLEPGQIFSFTEFNRTTDRLEPQNLFFELLLGPEENAGAECQEVALEGSREKLKILLKGEKGIYFSRFSQVKVFR